MSDPYKVGTVWFGADRKEAAVVHVVDDVVEISVYSDGALDQEWMPPDRVINLDAETAAALIFTVRDAVEKIDPSALDEDD